MALILAKTGWDRPRKREKNSTPEFCSDPTRASKFQIKNSKKIQKIKKVNSDIISIQNGLGEGKNEKKKNLFLNSVHTQPVQVNSEKNRKKIKNLKNLFLALVLAKTGWDRPRKSVKNFTPEFCSYPTRASKFQIKNSKKIQKIKKVNSDIIFIQNGLG